MGTGTGVWHHPRLPLVPFRWVLVRDPEGRFDPPEAGTQALLSTDQALTAPEMAKLPRRVLQRLSEAAGYAT